MNLTQAQYEEFLRKTGKPPAPVKRKNKYNAQRVWVDGIHFDSQKEADYYLHLKLLVRAGIIAGFTYHGNMVCTEGTDHENRATLYETDFVILYDDKPAQVVDVKGMRTEVYKLKRKMLREKYPKVEVQEE